MTLRVINNGRESFRETTNRIIINDQHRTVYSRREAGEHVEYVVFLLYSELANHPGKRFFVVAENQFINKKVKK